MKTKLSILAALIFAGLTFSSCSKDNSIQPENPITVTDQPSKPTHIFEFHPDDIP